LRALFQSEAELDLEVVSSRCPYELPAGIMINLWQNRFCHVYKEVPRLNTQLKRQISLSIIQGWAQNELKST
jgi:hypothetical protein